MINSIKKSTIFLAIKILPRKRLYQFMPIIFLMLIGAFFEVVSVGMVFPLLQLINDDTSTNNYIIKIFPSLFSELPKKDLFIWYISIFVFIFLIKGFYLSFLAWISGRYTHRIKAEISNSLMRKYLSAPYVFHLKNNSAKLIRNLTTESSHLVIHALNPILVIMTESIFIAAILIFLFVIEPLGTFTALFFMIFSSFFFHIIARNYSLKYGKFRQDADGQIVQKAQEALGGIKDIKVIGKINFFLSSFFNQNYKLSNIAAKQHLISQLPRHYLESMGVIALAIMVLVLENKTGNLNSMLPTLGMFLIATFRFLPSANRILSALNSLSFAQPILELIYKQQRICSQKDLLTEKNISQENQITFNKDIKIENIFYKYPNSENYALNDITLKIKKGESIAIIGKSGAGKSTFSEIILGLLEPSSGSVIVDGLNVKEITGAWQQQIGYVQQNIFLNDDTLRNNIAFGLKDSEIDVSKLNKAIKESQLEDLVKELPNGINSYLGERGIRLSGGQRQRIGIARSLYRNTPILVFDEATSSLDNETEREIINAIRLLKGSKTIIIIAHRLSTIDYCDRVIEMHKGSIVKIT